MDKQDIVQSVQISGTVVTGEEKTYFSGVSVPVESLAVVAGDHVTEGQTLLTFSTERLDFTKTQAELKESAANGDYSSSMTKDAKSSADLAEANARLPELEQQILAVQETIDQYNIMIEEKQRRMAATGMELQKALIDSTAGTDEYQKLQLLVQENSYAQQNDQEVADWKDKYMRLAAEYENYRKRTANEKLALYDDATAKAVTELLPVSDSVRMALENLKDTDPEILKGVELISNQLGKSFEKLKISSYGEVGDDFDPNLHNAIGMVDNDELGSGKIAAVYQTGFKIGDKIIRHAMVQVTN